jgi:hypothetical protein
MTSLADYFIRFWQRKENALLCIIRGRLKIAGSIPEALFFF